VDDEDYTVRRIQWSGHPLDGRYEVTGGPTRGPNWLMLTRWSEQTWTLWGAKRVIRKRKKALAQRDEIVYREAA